MCLSAQMTAEHKAVVRHRPWIVELIPVASMTVVMLRVSEVWVRHELYKDIISTSLVRLWHAGH